MPPNCRLHLAECSECQEIAALERHLHRLLSNAPPEADRELQRSILRSIGSRPRRRLLAWLPMVVGLLIGGAGALVLGGVPGIGLARLLPGWAGQAPFTLARAVADWSVALVAVARAAAAAVPLTVRLGAVAAALGGAVWVAVLARRARRSAVWR